MKIGDTIRITRKSWCGNRIAKIYQIGANARPDDLTKPFEPAAIVRFDDGLYATIAESELELIEEAATTRL